MYIQIVFFAQQHEFCFIMPRGVLHICTFGFSETEPQRNWHLLSLNRGCHRESKMVFEFLTYCTVFCIEQNNRHLFPIGWRICKCVAYAYPYLRSLLQSEPVFLKQYMGARNRVGLELLYRPGRLDRLAESNPWNWYLKSKKIGLSTPDRVKK